MKYSFYGILLFISVTLSSCFEVIEDVTVRRNGSGTYKFIVNLSQSKNQIDKIRTQDSILHYRVPSSTMIDEKIAEVKNKLQSINGISNVTIKQDHTNYIYNLSCDFKNVSALNAAVQGIWKNYDKNAPATIDLYHYENGVFKRTANSSEVDHLTKSANSQIIEMLQKSDYTIICRFDTIVTNDNAMNYSLSASKKAVLYKNDIWSTLAIKGKSNNSITVPQ